MEFISEANPCGQSLLKLVARGSAILAELFRLSGNIPKVFLGNSAEAQRYAAIVFDYEYFKNQDVYEERIQSNNDLLDLDEAFKNNYMVLLERFYTLFDSIYKFYLDIQSIIEQINEGVFIQYTLENILQINEGKKLLGEAFFHYGCMLLLMDSLIPGVVREKIMVSYVRYKGGQDSLHNITEVFKLTRQTGYVSAKYNNGVVKIPDAYPNELFSRFAIDKDVVWQIISSIQDDDIYHQTSAYPSPEHRSVALSSQASMLFILLYFVPKVLERDFTKMREIVDKHFADNWVLPYYMGYIVDLSTQWDHYKAAKAALTNTLYIENIRELIEKFQKKLADNTKKLKDLLFEGALNEEHVLDKINQLIQVLREANFTLRWLILHRNTAYKKAADMILPLFNKEDILSLLLYTSQFEYKLKKLFEELLNSKDQRWNDDKSACLERIQELADFFSGKLTSSKIQPDENYSRYFSEIKSQIESLTYNDPTFAGRKMLTLIKALEDVEQFQQISDNLQIKSYLFETRQCLKHMVRTVQIRNQVLINLAQISDCSYAWQSLKEYRDLMQQRIKMHPDSALLLKSTFMKLSSILDAPMVRIIQANSPDMLSVSKYYSGELVKFIKYVLQIIPISIFDLLEDIIILLTKNLKTIPLKFNRTELRDYAQYEERQKMASTTYQISVFTESILVMETYLIGVVEVDPRTILEDGIRREIIKLICKILDKTLVFKTGKAEDFETRIMTLANSLENFKRAIEYIQDFVNIYGVKIWQEEFNRIINKYIDLEANTFLSKQMTLEELIDEEDYTPLPADSGENFMARLTKEILNITDAKRAIYVDSVPAFFDLGTYKECFGLKTLWLLKKSIGVSGLHGIDKLLSFLIVFEMKTILKVFKRELDNDLKKSLEELFKGVRNLDDVVGDFQKFYTEARKRSKTLFPSINSILQKIGQMVLIRQMICRVLSTSGRIASDKLYHALDNLNKSLINDTLNRPPQETPENPADAQDQETAENSVFYEISKLMHIFGMSEPSKKIYITSDSISNLPMVMFLILLNQIHSMVPDKKLHILVKKKKEDVVDYTQLLFGLMTFLNQFHHSNTEIFLGLIAQFIKSGILFSLQVKDNKILNDTKSEISNHIFFFEDFIRYSGHNIEYAENFLPLSLLSADTL